MFCFSGGELADVLFGIVQRNGGGGSAHSPVSQLQRSDLHVCV